MLLGINKDDAILEIEVIETDSSKYLRIKNQTYRGNHFFHGTKTFVASNGFKIISAEFPESRNYCFFVRGDDVREDNKVCPVVSEKWLDKLRKAVKEYNTKMARFSKSIEIIK